MFEDWKRWVVLTCKFIKQVLGLSSIEIIFHSIGFLFFFPEEGLHYHYCCPNCTSKKCKNPCKTLLGCRKPYDSEYTDGRPNFIKACTCQIDLCNSQNEIKSSIINLAFGFSATLITAFWMIWFMWIIINYLFRFNVLCHFAATTLENNF